jgi:hypothetical protein
MLNEGRAIPSASSRICPTTMKAMRIAAAITIPRIAVLRRDSGDSCRVIAMNSGTRLTGSTTSTHSGE